jgi:hypothetical protein
MSDTFILMMLLPGNNAPTTYTVEMQHGYRSEPEMVKLADGSYKLECFGGQVKSITVRWPDNTGTSIDQGSKIVVPVCAHFTFGKWIDSSNPLP